MGWEGTRMLTNGEHDELWRNVFAEYVPNIAKSIRRMNDVSIIEKLYKEHAITKEAYIKCLKYFLNKEGVQLEPEDFIEN